MSGYKIISPAPEEEYSDAIEETTPTEVKEEEATEVDSMPFFDAEKLTAEINGSMREEERNTPREHQINEETAVSMKSIRDNIDRMIDTNNHAREDLMDVINDTYGKIMEIDKDILALRQRRDAITLALHVLAQK